MQKIKPSLWYDKEAKQAADFYVSAFQNNSEVNSISSIHNTPSGDVDIISFTLLEYEFMAISAGPLFKFNPAISFLVACDTKTEVEKIWHKLVEGGKILMPIDAYPFSKRYGWLEDKYGLSWQIMYNSENNNTHKITPTLMFTENQCGKSEKAITFYTSIFKNSKLDNVLRYGSADKPDKKGTIKHAGFTIENQAFAAMDSARGHNFSFNESISFMVYCDTQNEIDYYWERLSAVPESEQCGWLKDKYGVSWQIVPTAMETMLSNPDPIKSARVTEAFLKMKKYNIAELEKAYYGN